MPAIPLPNPALSDGVVTLRPPVEADAEAVCDYCQDPEIGRWTVVPAPYSREDALSWIASAASGPPAGERAEFLIVSAGDAGPLGSCGLARVFWEEKCGEIGYLVAAPARRQGVGARAVRLLSRWALEELGLERVEILVNPDNLPSRRLALAAGFSEEGLLRSYRERKGTREDRVVFSLIRADLGARSVRSRT
jgi:RimJ/RimL family protein N-acetyltransferase